MFKGKAEDYFQTEDPVDTQTLVDMRESDEAINDLVITIPAGIGTTGLRFPASWECVVLRPVIIPEGTTTIRLHVHLELAEPNTKLFNPGDYGALDFRFGVGLTSIVSDAEVRVEDTIVYGATGENSIQSFELDVLPRTLPYMTMVQLWMRGNPHDEDGTSGAALNYTAMPELITPQQVRTPDELQFTDMPASIFEQYNMIVLEDGGGTTYDTPRVASLVYRSQAGNGPIDETGAGNVQVMGVYPMSDILNISGQDRAWAAVPFQGGRIGECCIELVQDIRYLHTAREADLRAGDPLISSVAKLLLGFQDTLLAGPRPALCESNYKGIETQYLTVDKFQKLVPHHLLCDSLDIVVFIPRATFGDIYYEPDEMVITVKDLDGTTLETETRDLTALSRPGMDRDPTAYDFFGTTNSRPWVPEQIDAFFSESWAIGHTITDLYQHRGVESGIGPRPFVLEIYIEFPGGIQVPPGLVFVSTAETPAGADDV